MTTTYPLGEVVAQRQVDAVAADGSRSPVVLEIGTPRPDTMPGRSGEDWYCPRRILGLGDEAVTVSFGVDSLQALLLCVYSAKVRLAERADAASVRLDWLGVPDLGLGTDPEAMVVPRPG